EVGIVAGDERAAAALVAGDPRRRDARGTERLVHREALLGVPRITAVDRATYAGPDAREWVELLDRRIGPVRDDGARGEQRLERVRAVGLAGPKAVREVAVGRRVRELHRTRDAELRKAGEILRSEQLAVLDPMPQSERRPHVLRRLERVERLA